MENNNLGSKKEDLIFQINNLKCKYPKKKKNQIINDKIVFKLDNLKIHRGKITIILGLSGSGKSTFLETIGLMTKTIQEGSKVEYFDNKFKSNDLLELWGKSQEEQDRLRKENFSFIFQDTNLMPNFSNVNNVALADLKDSNSHNLALEEVREKACLKLVSLGLPKHSILDSPKEISGGQRQRVAFSRAILPDFKVLFGDEPTGNLDFKHADYLMSFIREEIKTSNHQKSAIIVSHNIPLTIDHADEIMVLSKPNNGNKETFTILPENIFIRTEDDGWAIKQSNEKLSKNKLNSIIEAAISGKKTSNDEGECLEYANIEKNQNDQNGQHEKNRNTDSCSLTKIKLPWYVFGNICYKTSRILYKNSLDHRFTKLFFSEESEEFAGKRMKYFKRYMYLLLVVYLIIGVMNGVNKDLELKLTDPFINELDIPLEGSSKTIDKISSFVSSALLGDKEIKDRYKIDTAYKYTEAPFNILYNNSESDKGPAWSRSIVYNDPILKIITDSLKNNAYGRSFTNRFDYGVIVTKNFLKRFNYDTLSPWVLFPHKENHNFPLPVIAIVKELPGDRQDLIMTKGLWANYNHYTSELLTSESESVYILTNIPQGSEDDFINILKKSISEIGYNANEFEVYSYENIDAYKKLFEFSIDHGMFSNLKIADEFYERLMQTETMAAFIESNDLSLNDFVQSYSPENYNYNLNDIAEANRLEILLKGPERIIPFAKYIYKEIGIKLEMERVKNLETFNWVSNSLSFVLVVVILISTYAIIQFIFNIFNFLLFKIRKNIGTLKAFGITVNKLYSLMVIVFVFSGLFFTMAVSFILGLIINKYLITFSYFDNWVELLFFILPFVSIGGGLWWIIHKTHTDYFNQSPGDLIYDRINGK